MHYLLFMFAPVSAQIFASVKLLFQSSVPGCCILGGFPGFIFGAFFFLLLLSYNTDASPFCMHDWVRE